MTYKFSGDEYMSARELRRAEKKNKQQRRKDMHIAIKDLLQQTIDKKVVRTVASDEA